MQDPTPCEAIVRKADYDRYLSALFAPPPMRIHLFALYSFNYEVAKTAESVSQPVMGQIRLQWWRDAIDEIYAGRVRKHEVAEALASTIAARDLPRLLFDALIDARESDLEDEPFADIECLEAYADATSGHVMQLAARILGAHGEADSAAREAGIAFALTGLARALPFHAARHRLMWPKDWLEAGGVTSDELFAGQARPRVAELVHQMMARARTHLDAARSKRVPRTFLPALLPAALVPNYLKALTRPGFDIFRDDPTMPIHRRQLAMLGAVMRGSV